MEYKNGNIFEKILKGELECKKIFEDEFVLSFWDAYPKAKYHALVIPKALYATFQDFALQEGEWQVGSFFKKVNFIALEVLKLGDNFKLLINNGKSAGQEVFHFHVHILSN